MEKLKVERNLQDNTLTIDGIEFNKEQTKAIDDFLDCFSRYRINDLIGFILDRITYNKIDLWKEYLITLTYDRAQDIREECRKYGFEICTMEGEE